MYVQCNNAYGFVMVETSTLIVFLHSFNFSGENLPLPLLHLPFPVNWKSSSLTVAK